MAKRIIVAAILDRAEVLPLIEGLPLPYTRLIRSRRIRSFWHIYFKVEDEDDPDAIAETFEFCVSPRVEVFAAGFRTSDCDPDEVRITFYVRADQ